MRPLTVVMALSLAFVSDTAAIQSQARTRQAIIDGLSRREISAVVEAEQSGDRTLMPFVLAQLEFPSVVGRPRDVQFDAAAHHAITALADRRQLQVIWCEAVREDDLIPQVERLGLIGGWFGIRGLQELLKPERQKNWERAVKRRGKRDRDLTYIGPRDLALLALSETVSNPPVTQQEAAVPRPATPLVNRWNDWIAAHREELEKLAPTGEGVDYTERACKSGKPVKR